MDAYIGEIRWFTYNYVPAGWLFCDGKLLSIQAFSPLYSLLGVRFGGDGRTTFGLPNLVGRAIAGPGVSPAYTKGMVLGKPLGTVITTVEHAHMPVHTHQMVRPGGTKNYPQKSSVPNAHVAPGSLAKADNSTIRGLTQTGAPDTPLHPAAVSTVGGGSAHDNMQPYLTLVGCICHDGEYPVNPD